MRTVAMTKNQDGPQELISLGEAERECRERLGMSPAEFRHALAEHVRGAGGIPWIATEAAVGGCRDALDQFARKARMPDDKETSDDQRDG